MPITIEDFRIDVAKVQSFKYLQAKQFDNNSRKRRLIITDSNIPIQYSDDRSEYITLSLSLNGDNYSNTSCSFEADGYPYIIFTESMLSKVGDVDCEIRIYDHKNGSIITSFPFIMTISKSLLNQDRLVESSEFNILNDLVLQAITIPDLINEFQLSQENISNLIVQINNDIDSYRGNYTSLSTDFRNLIADVQNYLTDIQERERNRVSAEQDRVNAENKRQQDTAHAIGQANTAADRAAAATNHANTAAANAQNVTAQALQSAVDANAAKDQCLAAIDHLQYEMRVLDGDAAATLETSYENAYDGGGA
ncbi:MAG: BppU family phage baseplate upper protein [Lachnospiraceae bacterium]|jgi:hypothetical protein|nr:BppU family phage baseplate upper protein [Lachnospiraceae bacterium]MCI9106218.1 BppU family phage baseplate upper protein [Lachnospiraceae bacterium]